MANALVVLTIRADFLTYNVRRKMMRCIVLILLLSLSSLSASSKSEEVFWVKVGQVWGDDSPQWDFSISNGSQLRVFYKDYKVEDDNYRIHLEDLPPELVADIRRKILKVVSIESLLSRESHEDSGIAEFYQVEFGFRRDNEYIECGYNDLKSLNDLDPNALWVLKTLSSRLKQRALKF